MKKKEVVFVIMLFLAVLGLRLYFAFQSPHFSYDSYFHLRIIEQIAENGHLLTSDSLSYGGRTIIVLPLFYYILGLLGWVFPLPLVTKVVPHVFLSLLPVIIFFIVRKITTQIGAAFFSAVISAFVPVLFADTLYSLSPTMLVLPFVFLTLFLFLHIDEKSSVVFFVILVTALSLLHPSSALLITGLIGYLVVSRLEKFRLEKTELELIFFTTFVFLWLLFIFYKRAFLFHGLTLIQQNIPIEIVSRYFTHISFTSALVQIGIIPLVGGIFTIYKYLFNMKNKPLYMYISLGISVTILLWFRLLQPTLGFVYLSVCLCILSGPAYVSVVRYFRKTRISSLSPFFIGIIWLLIVPIMMVPTIYLSEQKEGISAPVFDALLWLRENTSADSVVLGAPHEGHAIAAIAGRKNVMDDYFLLIGDADERLVDVKRAFITPFATEAAKIFEKYDVDYVLVSRDTRAVYSISSLAYKDEECIREVYNKDGTTIFHTRCRITVV